MKTIKRKSNFKRNIIIISLAAVLLLGGGAGSFALYNANKQQSKESTTSNPSSTPNKSESTNNQPTPDDSVKQPDSPDKNPAKPASKTIAVVVVEASQYNTTVEVRSYAEASEAGTCTYTFSQNSTSFQKKGTANSGPSTASCETLSVPVSDFPNKGAWNITIEYASNSGAYSGNTKTSVTIK